MKTVITALLIQVEQTVYDDENRVVSRPDPRQSTYSVFEVDIPASVLQWVGEKLAAKGGS
jgi:hypothetical protein